MSVQKKNVYVYFISVFPDKKKKLLSIWFPYVKKEVQIKFVGFGLLGCFFPHQDWVSDQPDVLFLLFVLFPVKLNPGR